MNDQTTQQRQTQTFQSLDDQSAKALLREASIGRQSQSGRLSSDQEENIRMGRQDQSIGFEDAVYALTHADKVWPQVQTQMGKQR